MLTKTITINCPIGLHARPASVLVDIASQFESSITMKYKDRVVPLNSIIGVMALGVESGEAVEIVTSGTDEKEAMSRMEAFFEIEIREL